MLRRLLDFLRGLAKPVSRPVETPKAEPAPIPAPEPEKPVEAQEPAKQEAYVFRIPEHLNSPNTLGNKQRLFTYLMAQFILRAYVMGYELTFGEAHRTPVQASINALTSDGRKSLAAHIGEKWSLVASAIREQVGGGTLNSLHRERLAVDLNAFKGGVFLTKTEDYTPLGELWESMHPLCRAGYRFGDGNHFSLTPDGKRA